MSREIGCYWEKRAGEYLSQKGYHIQEFNFNTKYGEIDLIATDEGIDCKWKELVFVEVKYRSKHSYGNSFEYVSKSKLLKMQKAISIYLSMHPHLKLPYRVDVLSFDVSDGEIKTNHFINITF